MNYFRLCSRWGLRTVLLWKGKCEINWNRDIGGKCMKRSSVICRLSFTSLHAVMRLGLPGVILSLPPYTFQKKKKKAQKRLYELDYLGPKSTITLSWMWFSVHGFIFYISALSVFRTTRLHARTKWETPTKFWSENTQRMRPLWGHGSKWENSRPIRLNVVSKFMDRVSCPKPHEWLWGPPTFLFNWYRRLCLVKTAGAWDWTLKSS